MATNEPTEDPAKSRRHHPPGRTWPTPGRARFPPPATPPRWNSSATSTAPPVRFEAKIKDPLRFREAMSALYAVVGSDFRYVPKDRTAYIAYLRLKRDVGPAGRLAGAAGVLLLAPAQRPDGAVDPRPGHHGPPRPGLLRGLQQGRGGVRQARRSTARRSTTTGTAGLRHDEHRLQPEPCIRASSRCASYRETRLAIGQEGVKVDDRRRRARCWRRRSRFPTRGCGASSRCSRPRPCRSTTFALAPIDLYNVLRHLRLHGDRKGKRRGLRFELVPGETAAAGRWSRGRRSSPAPPSVQGQGRAGRPRLGPAPADDHAAVPAVRRGGGRVTCSAAACRASGCSAPAT